MVDPEIAAFVAKRDELYRNPTLEGARAFLSAPPGGWIDRGPTMEALAQCCEREAKLRGRVYPRWVEAGRIEKAKADLELRLMQAAAAHFRAIADEENRKGRLL